MSDIAALPEVDAQGDLPPFLDGESKQDIIDNQHGFLITAARPHVPSTNPAMFKDQVMYEIAFLSKGAVDYLCKNGFGENGKIKTSTGELVDPTMPNWAENSSRWMLALSHNDVREAQAKKIAEVLALGSNMVGPCWFSEIPSKTAGFNPTRVIIGHPQPVAKKTKKQPVAATTTSDSDIPF